MPVAERLDVFTPFLKKERDDDGVLWVEGKFTGPDLDSDGQRMDLAWLRSAVPDYMRSAGNVREQHDGHRAIGKAVEAWETDDGSWHMRAKIVDPVAEKKIEHGILSGFSIGVQSPIIVKAADAPHGKCAGGSLVEVSCVDRPALGTARLRVAGVLGKAAGTLELIDTPALEEDPDVDVKKAAEGDVIARPQMLLKTSDGQVRPMTAALVDELTAPTVVANLDDPDAADPEALEKAKKGKPFGGNKAKPFGGKPKADNDSDDDPDTEDDDEKKKPAAKAATPDVDAIVKAVLAELAKQQTTAETPTEPAAPADVLPDDPPVEKAAEPDLAKAADDEMADIARAKRILADLACLVQSEAAGFLGGGGFGEVADLNMLVDVMATLTCFVERETYELEAAAMADNTPAGGDTTPTPTVIQLAAEPDVTKTPPAPDLGAALSEQLEKRLKKMRKALAKKAAAEKAAAEPDMTKAATTADTPAETVPAQGLTFDDLTKAIGPVMDRLAEVQARSEALEVLVKSTPRPGGPAVTRVAPVVPSEQLAKAAQIKARRDTYEGMLRGASTAGERAAISALIAELDKPAA